MRAAPLTALLSTLVVALVACSGDDGGSSASEGAGSTSAGSTSAGSTSAGSMSEGSTSEGSTSEGSTSAGSMSEGSTSEGSTSAGSTSEGSTSEGATSEGTSAGSTGGSIESCDDFYPVFAAEVAAIRGCSLDSECGQVLKGTSCGCTRDWVARVDADPAEFYALVELAGELRCELPFISTCDCPAADGYRCDAGTCAWNYL